MGRCRQSQPVVDSKGPRGIRRAGDALAEQYNQFEPFPGFKVNGRLTLGENLADLAGLTIACEAYKLSLAANRPP